MQHGRVLVAVKTDAGKNQMSDYVYFFLNATNYTVSCMDTKMQFVLIFKEFNAYIQ